MKKLKIIMKMDSLSKQIKKIGVLSIIFLAMEASTVNIAVAQRRGGFGHGGFAHGGFGHYGFAHGGFGHAGHFGWGFGPFWFYSFAPIWGGLYWYLPYAAFNFYYDGLDYYLWNGIYYRDFDGKYEVVPAPVGYKIKDLPQGAEQVSVDGVNYYYYYGTYYVLKGKKYEVVPAPIGAVVSSIPQGYDKVEINGQTYYTLSGIQYKPILKNNEVWYQVIKSTGNESVNSAPPQPKQNVTDTLIIH